MKEDLHRKKTDKQTGRKSHVHRKKTEIKTEKRGYRQEKDRYTDRNK